MLLASASGSSIWDNTLGLLSVPVLIAVNAFFVAAQFSLVALRRTRVEEMERQKVPGAPAVAKAMDDLDRCVAATQLGTVLVGLLLGWVGEPAVAAFLEPLFESVVGTWHGAALRSASTVLTFLVITFMSVVFSELIPKTIGLQSSEGTALWVSRPLLWFTRLAHPLVHFMDGAGNWILRRFGYDPDAEAEKPHSVEELTLLIEDSAEAGVLLPTQATFVANLLRLSEKKVANAMQPIDKIAGLELSADPQAILEQVLEKTFTRMPVYQGSLDNILGIANTKLLLRNYIKTGILKLEDVIYPAIVVKPDARLPDVLKALRDARYPMGIVRDGDKVVGLLTLEDVHEEVVGDMLDEHDYPAPKVTPRMVQAVVQGMPKRKPGETRSIKVGHSTGVFGAGHQSPSPPRGEG